MENKRFFILIVIFSVLFVETVTSEEEISIKKGTFPYMAFVYYPDQTESISTRFTRSAVLIRENWLITSSLGNDDNANAFPEKTLIARLGAITIDSNFTFNEDEEEQEREIIQIVRPHLNKPNSTEWWNTDISLLKTLMPFNMTSSVAPVTIRSHKFGYDENCFILFYGKRSQNERFLMQMFIEIIPSSLEKCGEYFKNETMICANKKDEKIENTDSDFCRGNSGGPLICNNELTGTQTYINDCTEPYLFQLLAAWDDLMICAMEEKCQEEQCAKICWNFYKDPPSSKIIKFETTEDVLMKLADGFFNDTSSEIDILPTVTTTTTTIKQVEEIETTKTTISLIIDEQVTTSTISLPSVTHTSTTIEDTLVSSTASSMSESSEITIDETTEYREEHERNVNVEAQQKRLRSDATINTMSLFDYFIYSSFILTSYIGL